MKKLFLICVFSITYSATAQITLNQKDDFEDYTTANWTRLSGVTIPNQNIPTGGPEGENDNFLRVQSALSEGYPTGLLNTRNMAQWTGNYINAGVTYISMDVRNSGNNVIFLRLAFESFGLYLWSSITNFAILPGEDWKTIVFPINENSIICLSGSFNFSESFQQISEVRILHDDAPGWEGYPIDATLDIDNIQARDSNMDVVDLAALKSNIKVYPNPATDFIRIEGLSEIVEFQIFNTSGALVKSGKVANGQNIGINHLPKGVYLFKLENGKALKFIKN